MITRARELKKKIQKRKSKEKEKEKTITKQIHAWNLVTIKSRSSLNSGNV